ncbi:phytanoyl-CoA dioxygenase [Cryptosporangium sp. NPDC051539]|uniref:phytanoyl-CoA dioxygenase n=1 Tax=Cryptosporangium sp. NPDC051539 TaxID=3363962 RepID=UPI0037A85AB6
MNRREIEQFERDGYVAVRGAIAPEIAAACRDEIWNALAGSGVTRDPASWTHPVVLVPCPPGSPFVAAGTAPALGAAYDTLIGPGRWGRRQGVGGMVPVRFPSEEFPGDCGWHIEGSYEVGGEYWANVRSRARGLLALFLFTDVGDDDAPTRLALGSHLAVPRLLADAGETGKNTDDALSGLRPSVLCRTATHATGRAGDVFLCHPFIVHTATWPHRGRGPRMMAQPAVYVEDGFAIDGSDLSPVARAIVAGLGDDSSSCRN